LKRNEKIKKLSNAGAYHPPNPPKKRHTTTKNKKNSEKSNDFGLLIVIYMGQKLQNYQKKQTRRRTLAYRRGLYRRYGVVVQRRCRPLLGDDEDVAYSPSA
jgi:hypothetical protein